MEKGYSCHLDDNVREEYPIWGMEQGAIICYLNFGLYAQMGLPPV